MISAAPSDRQRRRMQHGPYPVKSAHVLSLDMFGGAFAMAMNAAVCFRHCWLRQAFVDHTRQRRRPERLAQIPCRAECDAWAASPQRGVGAGGPRQKGGRPFTRSHDDILPCESAHYRISAANRQAVCPAQCISAVQQTRIHSAREFTPNPIPYRVLMALLFRFDLRCVRELVCDSCTRAIGAHVKARIGRHTPNPRSSRASFASLVSRTAASVTCDVARRPREQCEHIQEPAARMAVNAARPLILGTRRRGHCRAREIV